MADADVSKPEKSNFYKVGIFVNEDDKCLSRSHCDWYAGVLWALPALCGIHALALVCEI